MTAGAAYGAGIYLSTEGTFSMSYSRMGGVDSFFKGAGQVKSEDGNAFLISSGQLRLLALCEVALVPSLRKNGHIWVAPEEESVVTRFLFAFSQGASAASGALKSDEDKFDAEVRACLQEVMQLG